MHMEELQKGKHLRIIVFCINQTDKEHFTVTARRRTNGNYVKVIVWVHDRMDCYWIGKVHVTPLLVTFHQGTLDLFPVQAKHCQFFLCQPSLSQAVD